MLNLQAVGQCGGAGGAGTGWGRNKKETKTLNDKRALLIRKRGSGVSIGARGNLAVRLDEAQIQAAEA